jgi:hypothetical protein
MPAMNDVIHLQDFVTIHKYGCRNFTIQLLKKIIADTMKKTVVLVAILISGWGGVQTAEAQVNISFNIGAQPSWGASRIRSG